MSKGGDFAKSIPFLHENNSSNASGDVMTRNYIHICVLDVLHDVCCFVLLTFCLCQFILI